MEIKSTADIVLNFISSIKKMNEEERNCKFISNEDRISMLEMRIDSIETLIKKFKGNWIA